jgi:hypothetical protein
MVSLKDEEEQDPETKFMKGFLGSEDLKKQALEVKYEY